MTVQIPKTRAIPTWLVILLIVACTAGGGYLAYWLLRSGNHQRIAVLKRSVDETVRKGRDDRWWIHSDDPGRDNGQATFDLRDASKPQVSFLIYPFGLTPEQNNLLNLAGDRWMQDDVHVTGAQIEQLRHVPSAHVDPPKDMLDAMLATFLQWQKAPEGGAKEDLADQLYDQLDKATQAVDAQSHQLVNSKCDKIRAILTPQQQKQIADYKSAWQR